MRDAIQKALAERDAYLEGVGGCSNAHCIVWDPPGMRTNGGCKCSTDRMTMQRYAFANNRFAKAVRAALTTTEPSA